MDLVWGIGVEPRSRLKTVGDRAFSVVGPRKWNHLPGEIRDCQTLFVFLVVPYVHILGLVLVHVAVITLSDASYSQLLPYLF